MRLAIVTTSHPSFEGQAAGHFVAAEAAALARLGHDVVVIAPGPGREIVEGAPLVVKLPGLGLFGPPGALARLRQKPWRAAGGAYFAFHARRELVRRGPFDRIIGHWLVPSVWPIAAGLPVHTEAVIHGSDWRLFRRLPRALRQRLLSGWWRDGTEFRCVSAAIQADFLDLAGARFAARVRVEPATLALDAAPNRESARHALGLPPGTRVVLVVARLIRAKRVDVALSALSQLPNVLTVVVGAGPEASNLRRNFPYAHFTGELPRSEALRWIAAADVLISTSLTEGAPTVVREARALRVPVVACNAGDIARWAESDDGLWLAQT